MKLQARLLIAGIVVVAPLAIAVRAGVIGARAQFAEDVLAQHALSVMEASRAACEAAPSTWGGDALGRPPEAAREPLLSLFAYGPDLRSANPTAPPIPPALTDAARRARRQASARLDERTMAVLVHTPREDGPCALALVIRAAPPGQTLPTGGPSFVVPLVSALLVIGITLVLLAPVVQRIRRLGKEVQQTARAGYKLRVTVDGSDELTELASAFDATGRELASHIDERERRERLLREFVSSTTHDLMMPLTVLQGHVSALRERAAAGQPADAVVVRAAIQELTYLASLIHNLGAAAKLDQGEPALARAPLDLCALVRRTASRSAALARELSVEIEHAVPGAPLEVVADMTLVEQALGNLVQNAIRYNRPGGHVAVTLEEAGPSRFRIAVMDDGPGIAPEDLARLQERGERGEEARTRHPHGQGLGLSIVQRVVAAHGWTLTLGPGVEGGLTAEIAGATSARAPGMQAREQATAPARGGGTVHA